MTSQVPILKRAADAEGCDFPGFGPHSLRRANINMAAGSRRQQIETSKIAGHANTKITEEYHRPDEFLLVRRASQRVTAQSP